MTRFFFFWCQRLLEKKMMEENKMQIKWTQLLLVSVCMMTVTFSDDSLRNSSLACTRGTNETYHQLDCGREFIYINRIFYGTTPYRRTNDLFQTCSSDGTRCNRTAPYELCCVRDARQLDCIFEDDNELSDMVRRCEGYSYCSFLGRRVNSSLGNCNATLYPTATSFSFIEYGCRKLEKAVNICANISIQDTSPVYLDSHFIYHEGILANTTCTCVVTSECGSALNLTAATVHLMEGMGTTCVEELSFQDAKQPDFKAQVTCHNKSLSNKQLFISKFNAAHLNLVISGVMKGQVFIRVQSSVMAANISVNCGYMAHPAMSSLEVCPNDPTSAGPSTVILVTPALNANASNSSEARSDIVKKYTHDYPHPGIIVGIALGAIIFITLTVFVSLYIYKQRLRKSDQDGQLIDNSPRTSSTTGSPATPAAVTGTEHDIGI